MLVSNEQRLEKSEVPEAAVVCEVPTAVYIFLCPQLSRQTTGRETCSEHVWSYTQNVYTLFLYFNKVHLNAEKLAQS